MKSIKTSASIDSHYVSHICRCRPGFSGSTCDVTIKTACHSDPCHNNGECFPTGFDNTGIVYMNLRYIYIVYYVNQKETTFYSKYIY